MDDFQSVLNEFLSKGHDPDYEVDSKGQFEGFREAYEAIVSKGVVEGTFITEVTRLVFKTAAMDLLVSHDA